MIFLDNFLKFHIKTNIYSTKTQILNEACDTSPCAIAQASGVASPKMREEANCLILGRAGFN